MPTGTVKTPDFAGATIGGQPLFHDLPSRIDERSALSPKIWREPGGAMVSTLSRGRTDREVPICTFSSIKPAKPLPLTRLGLRSLIAASGRMILNYSV